MVVFGAFTTDDSQAGIAVNIALHLKRRTKWGGRDCWQGGKRSLKKSKKVQRAHTSRLTVLLHKDEKESTNLQMYRRIRDSSNQ